MRTLRLALLLATLAGGAEPLRIVSTAPSITEILYALGLGDRVVGVTRFCRYPPEARTKTQIGTFLRPNLEVIFSLRPSLVIIQKNPVDLGSRLTAGGVPWIEIDNETIAGIHAAIDRIGEAAAVRENARRLNAAVRADLEDLRRRTAALPRRSMMFIVGRSPGALEGMVAVGRASYLNEVIEIAGGRNVFSDAVAAYPKVSLEEILARNADVIVDMGDMADTENVNEAHARNVVALWQRQTALAAVRNRRVFAVASDIYVVPGPRVVEAARSFARMLHPEARF